MATSASNEFEWIRYDLQGFSPLPKVNMYHKWSVLKSIADTLREVGGADLLHRFESGCFGHFMRMSDGPASARSLISLMTYQIKPINGNYTEIWFGVGGRAIRMGPPEYALISGLNFGSSSFDHTRRHDPTGLSTYMRFTGGNRIHVMQLLNRFTEKNVDGGTEDDYLKVANILALYFFVLAVSERKKIDPWVWVLVDNLAVWNTFAWGAYSYGVLRHYIGEFPTHRSGLKAKLHFYGPWWALQMWALEAIPTLGHVCSTIISPDQVPRCLRRKFKTLSYKFDLDQMLRQEVQCLAALIPSDFERECAPWVSTQIGHPMGSSSSSDFRTINREEMREMWRNEFLPELTETVAAKVTKTMTAKMTDFVKRMFRRGRSRGPSPSPAGSHAPDHSHLPDHSHGSRTHRDTQAFEAGPSGDHYSTPSVEGGRSGEHRSSAAREGRRSTDHRSIASTEGGMSIDRHSSRASKGRSSRDRRRDTDMIDNVSEQSVHSYRPAVEFIPEQEASRHSWSMNDHIGAGCTDRQPRHSFHGGESSMVGGYLGHGQISTPFGMPGQFAVPSRFGETFQFHQADHIGGPGSNPFQLAQQNTGPTPIQFSQPFQLGVPVPSQFVQPALAGCLGPTPGPSQSGHEGGCSEQETVSTLRPNNPGGGPATLGSTTLRRFREFIGDARPETVKCMRNDMEINRDAFEQTLAKNSFVPPVIIDLFLESMRSMLRDGDAFVMSTCVPADTRIVQPSFFLWIQNEWNEKCFEHRGQIHLRGGDYSWWQPDTAYMIFITGRDCGGSHWHGAKFLIMPLFLDGGSWVTVRICLASMRIELYDPSMPVKPTYNQKFLREVQLRPLTCFLVQYLRCGNYWIENSHKIPDPGSERFTLKLMPPKSRHSDIDDFSSPIHALMTVERLISGRPTVEWGNDPENMHFYRIVIAGRAFELCN